MSLRLPQHNRGFTLIELLVVIAIIGLLSSIVLASLNTARSKSRDARRESDLQSIQTALELYYSDHNTYPQFCGQAGSWSSWGACWTGGLASTYISQVPVDPQNIDLGNCGSTPNCHIYEYCQLSGGQHYVLAVNLENNPPAAQGNPSSAGCGNGGPNWYWLSN
ncbi:MAG: prepilin-type N-terminal cleavage/methylation domain-containing protein [Patescibacteria group bacterium]|nr:prepilin-type N-terminal cleavage/methylation domain-containing protein [Patescibacteria group bacterium]MDE1944274.1 prepilin-type N-terminal cleavage/methylation domain-containing protein [Patescibacteria group bacterium]MDE1944661.1 prepilin-type N-terminal cleavage/methylation domain-containing protein [Patescibacteria group bacterium]MDE2057347.1 prepilin-type N-terminal cleavage/methylation domain-containing protein [Patescibacteria group bacterium]